MLNKAAAAQSGSSVSTITIPRSPSAALLGFERRDIDALREHLVRDGEIGLDVVGILEQMLDGPHGVDLPLAFRDLCQRPPARRSTPCA